MESSNDMQEHVNNDQPLSQFEGENLARTLLNTQTSEQSSDTVHRIYDNSEQTDINAEDEEGRTKLMRAVESGDITYMKTLLNTSGVDVNKVGVLGYTALMLAVIGDHAKCVEVLVNAADIDVNKVNTLGDTALMLTANSDHVECVEVLVNAADIDVNKVNMLGDTALMLAMKGAESSPMSSAERSAYLKCIKALTKHPEAVIDVEIRKCILNLVIEDFYPEWLPYLKLTEGEAQDFMFKIK